MIVSVKLCPFCGHVPKVFFLRENSDSYKGFKSFIGCSNEDCIAHGCLNMTFSNVKDAVSLWNNRISNGDGFVKINVIRYEREVVKS